MFYYIQPDPKESEIIVATTNIRIFFCGKEKNALCVSVGGFCRGFAPAENIREHLAVDSARHVFPVRIAHY